MKAASTRCRSRMPMAGPARTTDSAAEPGSVLPLCSLKTTGPRNTAAITTVPSAARKREMTARGLGGGFVTDARGLGVIRVVPVPWAAGWCGAVGAAAPHAARVSAAAIPVALASSRRATARGCGRCPSKAAASQALSAIG